MVNVEALVEREVLRIGEAAHALGIDPQTLRRWVAKGLVPAWRMPGTGERRFAATIIVAMRRQLEGAADVHPVVEMRSRKKRAQQRRLAELEKDGGHR
jgi:excisionase family DNA binding protein